MPGQYQNLKTWQLSWHLKNVGTTAFFEFSKIFFGTIRTYRPHVPKVFPNPPPPPRSVLRESGRRSTVQQVSWSLIFTLTKHWRRPRSSMWMGSTTRCWSGPGKLRLWQARQRWRRMEAAGFLFRPSIGPGRRRQGRELRVRRGDMRDCTRLSSLMLPMWFDGVDGGEQRR